MPSIYFSEASTKLNIRMGTKSGEVKIPELPALVLNTKTTVTIKAADNIIFVYYNNALVATTRINEPWISGDSYLYASDNWATSPKALLHGVTLSTVSNVSPIPSPSIAWANIPGGLIDVSLNADGSLWGVNAANQIWYCANFKSCGWVNVPGGLKQISSVQTSGNSGIVCGCNSGDAIFCSAYTGSAVSWQQVPGGLKVVKVNADGSLWGVNSGDQIWYCANWKSCGWTNVPGSLRSISSVSTAANTGIVCGTNAGSNIYCSTYSGPSVGWFQVPGGLMDVNVNPDGSLWGVNTGNQIWYCNDYRRCNWVNIPGGLRSITSLNGGVCGTNSGDQIYCSTYATASPAKLSL